MTTSQICWVGRRDSTSFNDLIRNKACPHYVKVPVWSETWVIFCKPFIQCSGLLQLKAFLSFITSYSSTPNGWLCIHILFQGQTIPHGISDTHHPIILWWWHPLNRTPSFTPTHHTGAMVTHSYREMIPYHKTWAQTQKVLYQYP